MTLQAYDVCRGEGGEQAAASWATRRTFCPPASASAHGSWKTESLAEQGWPCQSFLLSSHSVGPSDPELLRRDYLLGIAAYAEPKCLRLFYSRPVSMRSASQI